MITQFIRKLVATALALAVLVAVAPTVAASVSVPPSMATAPSMIDCAMTAEKSVPIQERQAPCKDISNCLGMLGCAVPGAIPQSATAVSLEFQTLEPSWGLQIDHDGIALKPAHPPPIV